VTVQHQDFDQGADAVAVAVGGAGGDPELLVLGGEDTAGSGLEQRHRPGRPRAAGQDFQVVVRRQDLRTSGAGPLVPGHSMGTSSVTR